MRRFLIRFLNSKAFTKLWASFASSGLSRHFISVFSKLYQISGDTLLKNPKDFNSLQDFFTREINLGDRPLGTGHYVSPADGMISAAGKVDPEQLFTVKGREVELKTLLGDSDCNYRSYQIIYLSPHNYHRFHAPVDEAVRRVEELGDKSIPVNDLGYKIGNPLLNNHRFVIEFETIAMIPVGAVNVNSIILTNLEAKKGEELGRFCLGSTIILLYKEGQKGLREGPIRVRENLCLKQ